MTYGKRAQRVTARRAIRDIERLRNGYVDGLYGLFRLAFIRHNPFVLDKGSQAPYMEQRAQYDLDINQQVQHAVDKYRFGARALDVGNQVECDFIPDAVSHFLSRLRFEAMQGIASLGIDGPLPGRRQTPRWAAVY